MKYRSYIILFVILFFIFLYNISKAKEKWETISSAQGLPNKFIKDIKSDRENIYIATANGLGIYNVRNNRMMTLTQKDGLADNYISCIDIDEEDVWLGTDKGLCRYNKKTGKILTYTKQDGLVDNEISALLIADDYVWVGTSYWGISRYDKTINRWQTFSIINGLIDNSINCFSVDSGYIWIGTKSGLNYYDKITGLIGGYDTTQGLTEGNIRSIKVMGEYIWLGTINGLIRFNRYEENFKTYTTVNGLADDFIQSISIDGTSLWIGTFSGVTKYDSLNERFYTYTIKDGLIENSVSAIEIDGNYMWFGTDGGGISRFDKEIPEAIISPFVFYAKPGEITVIGSAFHYEGVGNYSIEYKNDAMKDYVNTGIQLLNNNNVLQGKLAEWDVSKLLNINYDVRLTVTAKNGKVNRALSTFIVDTKPPQLTLDPLPEAINAPTLYVKGTYIDDNIKEIIIMINNQNKEKADIDRILKKYSKEINIKSGLNNIEIIAYDIANQSSSIKYTVIYDKEKPVITLNEYSQQAKTPQVTLSGIVNDSGIQRIVLNPGNEEIPFEKKEENVFSFSYSLNLQPGFNKFEIAAYDYVGNKATVEPVIELSSSVPIIGIDKTVLKVQTEDYEVKGKWSDDNIDFILIEPFNIRATIDQKNRTFTAKVKLTKGENVITANIIDKEKNKNFDVATVLFTTEESKLNLVNLPSYTIDNVLNFAGKYYEQNIRSIIVNPGNINLSIDEKNNQFLGKVNLKKGENNFTLVMEDTFGEKTEKQFKVIYDDAPPEIIPETIPSTVYSPQVVINGTIKENYLDKFTILPYNISPKINPENNKFSATITIKEGKNDFQIRASDKAGHITTIDKSITFVPQMVKIESTAIDSDYVKELKAEIERLKNQLKSSATRSVVVAEKEFALPQKTGLVLVPYEKLKVNSFLDISQKYLGGIVYLDFLNKYNNISVIKPDNMVLIPTKNFIKSYLALQEKKTKEILDLIAISYRYTFMNYTDFKKRLGLYLLNKNYITKSEFTQLINNNYLYGDDFSLGINKPLKSSDHININLNFSKNFMTINIQNQNKRMGLNSLP